MSEADISTVLRRGSQHERVSLCMTRVIGSQCVDGFVFVVSSDARFLYVSESVSVYLGLSQVIMMLTVVSLVQYTTWK